MWHQYPYNFNDENTEYESPSLVKKPCRVSTLLVSGVRTSSMIMKQCRMCPYNVGTNVHAPNTTSYSALRPKIYVWHTKPSAK